MTPTPHSQPNTAINTHTLLNGSGGGRKTAAGNTNVAGTPAWRDQTILIEEGRIRAVGDSVDVTAPKGSRW